MLAEGHICARQYPLAMVATEAKYVRDRRNHDLANMGIVLQAAGTSLMAKGGAKAFNKLIKELTGG